jgi:DHA2 family multidrug resistance protein
LKTKNPIINVRLFKQGIVANGAMLVTFLGFFLYSVIFILPVFLTRMYGYSATQTGEFFIPGSLLTAMLMPFVGGSMARGINAKGLITVGMIGVELTLYSMTWISPVSSHGDILLTLYLRGFALAFLFVPINSSILSQFTGEALGQVSGLLNLFRQVGGSMGIALTSTLMTMKSQQNYLDLASHVSLLNDNTKAAYYGAVGAMGSKMTTQVGMGTSQLAALKAMSYRLYNQALMMSFNQLIWTIMVIFVFVFIPLYLLKLRVQPTKAIDAH